MFQSLLSWITPTNNDSPPETGRSARGFQSLLSWITPTNLELRRGRATVRQVSILVVLDHAHQHPQRRVVTLRQPVSILVVLDHAHQRRCSPRGPGSVAVSILVVLDHAHQRLVPEGVSRERDVSILVVLDHAHQRRRGSPSPRSAGGFNPCCPGSRPPTSGYSRPSGTRSSWFQSLLSWITPTNGTPQSVRPRHRCFNPCCPGSRPPTRNPGPLRVGWRDVSILVVLDHAHQRRGRPARRSRRPVSILVVMDQARQLRHPQRDRLHAGSARVSILVVMDQARQRDRHPVQVRQHPGVSILVVMDQARQPRSTCPGFSARSFQSLLSWIKLANIGCRRRVRPSARRFQSLLSWIKLANAKSARPRRRNPRCFNPCCHGSSSPTR